MNDAIIITLMLLTGTAAIFTILHHQTKGKAKEILASHYTEITKEGIFGIQIGEEDKVISQKIKEHHLINKWSIYVPMLGKSLTEVNFYHTILINPNKGGCIEYVTMKFIDNILTEIEVTLSKDYDFNDYKMALKLHLGKPKKRHQWFTRSKSYCFDIIVKIGEGLSMANILMNSNTYYANECCITWQGYSNIRF